MNVSLAARLAFFFVAVALTGLALRLSGGWLASIEARVGFNEEKFLGMTLLQACLIAQSLLCLVIALSSSCYRLLIEGQMPRLANNFEGNSYLSRRQTFICLAVITMIALILRVFNLNSCLWLDEISPLTFYRDTPAAELFTNYYSTNLHLLNTLLVKLSISAFGEHEWAVRLPAMLFGTATVPAIYWTARLALSREASLSAALITALSYHHIFFSQNARGYSAYVFFSLLTIGFFMRALAADRLSLWIGYASMSMLNFASLMASVLVFLSQSIVAVLAFAVVRLKPDTANMKIAAIRLTFVFSLISLSGVQLYAMVIPQAIAVMQRTYHDPSAGYFLFSTDFISEVMRGIKEALQGINSPIFPLLILIGLVVGFIGVYLLYRRHYALTLCLVLPNLLLTIFILTERMVVYPRFFILGLPLASMILALLAEDLAAMLSKRLELIHGLKFARLSRLSFQSMVVLLMVLPSALALPPYYARPKQDYFGAVQFLKPRRAIGYVIVALYHAEEGFSYYARRAGLKLDDDFFLVRSLDKFDQILKRSGQDKILLVTTFPRSLVLDHPEIKEKIEKSWKVGKVFSGTIGGGDICVWFPVQ